MDFVCPQSNRSCSRSRSRSRPKRRSPSVTRATSTKTTEYWISRLIRSKKSICFFRTIKNGNGNKKASSPSSTPGKFLPGRQISSHTLKKAEKISNSKLTNHNHSKTKDSDKNSSKNQTKKTYESLCRTEILGIQSCFSVDRIVQVRLHHQIVIFIEKHIDHQVRQLIVRVRIVIREQKRRNPRRAMERNIRIIIIIIIKLNSMWNLHYQR